ncbi:MAG: hypothetical protein M0R32_03560 [Candidatus Cloacimonetes bacterium]|jgi:hypothetical protein|nr:hypothetical protein [Candidatus Cloacimonadota bacterium]
MSEKDENTALTAPSPVDVYKASDGGGIREFLSSVINLADSGAFCEPTCPICLSKHRATSESRFEKDEEEKFDKKCDSIKKFFLARNEEMGISVIRNHFNNHLNQGEVELRKLEYVNRLATLNTTDRSTLDRLRVLMDALQERLVSGVELSQENRGKELVAISKAMTSILELRAKIMGEMQGRGEVITIPADKFNMAFEKALTRARGKEEIELVTSIMDSLSMSDEK